MSEQDAAAKAAEFKLAPSSPEKVKQHNRYPEVDFIRHQMPTKMSLKRIVRPPGASLY
jgi:hypothetical protein